MRICPYWVREYPDAGAARRGCNLAATGRQFCDGAAMVKELSCMYCPSAVRTRR